MRARDWLGVAALSVVASTAAAADLSYLQGLLDATPAGGWVQASTTTFGSAWPTGAGAAPWSPNNAAALPVAWSGFAWDSKRGDLIFSGGGHANYVGDEVYVWNGSNGAWTRGTLPSKVDLGTAMVVGQDAPQASHSFQTNTYAPVNDRYVVLGGGTWNSGGQLADANGRTGPWWWDPSLADANKVGGANGTGWDSTSQGSNSWQMRRNNYPWAGQPATPNVGYSTASAYRTEGGKDVIYYTMDSYGSGFPSLWRYELGTATTPDTWQRVGVTWNSVAGLGTAMVDSSRGLFVRAADNLAGYTSDLAIWNLANNNPGNPVANKDFGVRLVTAAGAEWSFAYGASLAYDKLDDEYVIWDSKARGSVWVTKPEFNADGSMKSVWTVNQFASTTQAQPVGNLVNGVWGKWTYVAELGAFVAMDAYNADTKDAAIWLYKPMAAVPEPAMWQALAVGLLVLAMKRRRRADA